MKLKAISILTLTLLLLMSCNKDDMNGVSGSGEESVVTLTIYDATASAGARAADGATEPADATESAVDVSANIKVVVFNENGTIAYPTGSDSFELTLTETAPGSGVYKTSQFKVTTGNKYFYVFANDASNKISAPTAGMNRQQFIAQTTAVANNEATDLTTTNFLMGTLWSEKKVAPHGGTPGDPKTVPLTIGRLVSKVTLKGVSKGTGSLAGNFTSPGYRLGSIPKKIFSVGNNDENLVAPPALGHGIVTSAVHSIAPLTGSSDANFHQYTATWKNVDNSFYTVENTTAPDNGVQFYGNTTYIQIRTVYTPDITEVYNVDDLSPKGSFTGPTFYTARLISNGARLIFEDDPREAANNPNIDIEPSSIQVYTGGLNYHKFPINDPQVGLPDVQKNAVLRNHAYQYTVTSIADLGSPDEEVDPTEPVETVTTLDIEVTIAPWSKIENNNVPI